MNEIALYVDFPFCNSKCHFCGYVAHIKTSDLVKQKHRYQDYVEALKLQIRAYGRILRREDYAVSSVYFGGGTPTALAPEQLLDVLSEIQTEFAFADHFQGATLETTPENVRETESFTQLREGGFDRVSMGVQSMSDERLRRIGRCHDHGQVEHAVSTLHASGFDKVNVDLMVGLPGETEEELVGTVEGGLALGVDHFTTYVYVPVPETVMKRFKEEEYTSEDLERKYALVRDAMRGAGYDEYMCQYFSNSGTRCVCDSVYFGLDNEWIGLGSDSNSLFRQRYWVGPSNYKTFIDAPTTPGHVSRPSEDLTFLETHYYWALLSEAGLVYDRWERLIGISFDEVLAKSPQVAAWHRYLTRGGLLAEDGSRLYFADRDNQSHYVCKRVVTNDSPELSAAFMQAHAC